MKAYATTIIPATANNMTGTAVVHSLVMDWTQFIGGAIQVVWTGTPTGVFLVEGSLNFQKDNNGNVYHAGTWNTLSASLTNPAGSAGSSLVDISLTGIPYIRVTYTNASGTGTLLALGCGKGG